MALLLALKALDGASFPPWYWLIGAVPCHVPFLLALEAHPLGAFLVGGLVGTVPREVALFVALAASQWLPLCLLGLVGTVAGEVPFLVASAAGEGALLSGP